MVYGDSPMGKRREFLKTIGAGSTVGLAGCLGSLGDKEFPNKPITFKVIAGQGGGYDYYTRLIKKYIDEEDLLPVDIKVENLTSSALPGRLNNIHNSESDGYTYGNVWPGFARLQAQGLDEVKYDVSKLTPMPSAGGNLRGITVRPDLGIDTPQEFIEATNAGELKFYTEGVRSTGTIVPVLFGELGGVFDLENVMNNYIVYDGAAEGVTATKRGEVDVIAGSLGSNSEFIKSGDLKPILVLTVDDELPDTIASFVDPDTPTLADIDVDQKEKIESLTSFKYYWNFCGPPDIPEERADVVREAMEEAIKNPDLQQEANEQGKFVGFGSSEAVGEDLTQKLDLWKEYLPLLSEMEEAAQR